MCGSHPVLFCYAFTGVFEVLITSGFFKRADDFWDVDVVIK